MNNSPAGLISDPVASLPGDERAAGWRGRLLMS
jgi:hypothetical protein